MSRLILINYSRIELQFDEDFDHLKRGLISAHDREALLEGKQAICRRHFHGCDHDAWWCVQSVEAGAKLDMLAIHPNYYRKLPAGSGPVAVVGPSIEINIDTPSPHFTQADKSRPHRLVDSGTDCTHPALSCEFGPDNNVVGGSEFVGDAYTNQPGRIPENDVSFPFANLVSFHALRPGTRDVDVIFDGAGCWMNVMDMNDVANIIGASSTNPFDVSGVTYEMTLTAHRVFGCSSTAPNDIIIGALLQAYHGEKDILSLCGAEE
ncbi:hypothetical protein FRC12_006748 [Ceratobasidium sp. 428]|nr:hypothetical protein FRC12_006748 [Ceratobasidium sp. 428]